MDTLFLRMLNISITATYIVIAIIALRFIFRKIPKKFYCALWGIVGLRLILPFSFESVLSLIPSAETVPLDIIYQRQPEINSGISFVNNSLNPVISSTFAPDEFTSANPLQILSFIASYVWLFGVILMLLYMASSYISLRLRMRTSISCEDNVQQSEKTSSPFVLGILNPKIYIPFGIEKEDLFYVIAHEKAHIRRGDHFYKPLGFILLSIYWFNPLMWVAYILLCRDIESACDEKVISQYSTEERRAYSTALLNCSIRHIRIAACPLAFGEVGIKQRIIGVMNYKKPAIWVIIIALILSLAFGVVFLTNPTSEKEIHGIWGNTYSITSIEYNSGKYENDAVKGFVVSEQEELGLIIDISPEFYLVLSMTMARPFEDSYLEKFHPTKENFDALFDGRYFTQGLSADKLRKENSRAWITSGERGDGIADTYILLCQENGDLYAVSIAEKSATFVFAIERAASLFDTKDLSEADVNNGVADKKDDNAAIISWTQYYVGNSNATNEFTKYVLNSKYVAYGSITSLPRLEINTKDDLISFMERHRDTLDYNATIEYKYTDGKTAPLNYMLTYWNDEFFSHSKLVFICIASKGGYRYDIESLGISEEEFRANVAQIGNYGDEEGYSNWIIAIEISKNTPAANVDRYEAVSVVGEEKYVYEAHDGYIKPYLVIRAKQGFALSFSLYSSYYATGTVEYSDKEITLNCTDGKKYVFEKSGNNYIFIASKSSEVPRFKGDSNATIPEVSIPDGAKFVFQDSGILALH